MPKQLGWEHLRQLLQQETVFDVQSFDQICKRARLFHRLALGLVRGDISTYDLNGLMDARWAGSGDYDLNAVPLAFRSFASALVEMLQMSETKPENFEGIPLMSGPIFHFSAEQDRALSQLVNTGDWTPGVTIAGFHHQWFTRVRFPWDGVHSSELFLGGEKLQEACHGESPMKTGLQLYYTGPAHVYCYNKRPALSDLQKTLRRRLKNDSLIVRYATTWEVLYYMVMHFVITKDPLWTTRIVPVEDTRGGFLFNYRGLSEDGRKPEFNKAWIDVHFGLMDPGSDGGYTYLLPIVEFN